MTWLDFISGFGGLCGLCLGISFVSVAEILYWFSIRFWSFLQWFRKSALPRFWDSLLILHQALQRVLSDLHKEKHPWDIFLFNCLMDIHNSSMFISMLMWWYVYDYDYKPASLSDLSGADLTIAFFLLFLFTLRGLKPCRSKRWLWASIFVKTFAKAGIHTLSKHFFVSP